jgi:glucan 1,3-beta-glucosidase
MTLPVWIGTAVMAFAGGSLAGWALENVPLESLGPGGWARSLALAALALLSAPVAAAALARGMATPGFASLLARADERPRDRLALGLGLLLIVLTVVALEVTLALVFNPRYRDFSFAPLTAAVVPFLVLSLLGPRRAAGRPVAETIAAAVLAGSVVYIVPNEGIANWQALWLSAAMLGLAVILFRARDGRSSGS